VSLADEDTGVVDGLGQSQLEDLCLQASVEEVLNLESEDVIKLHLVFLKDSVAHQAAEKSVTLEQALGVLKHSAVNPKSSKQPSRREREALGQPCAPWQECT
jgi:hypothetical protein